MLVIGKLQNNSHQTSVKRYLRRKPSLLLFIKQISFCRAIRIYWTVNGILDVMPTLATIKEAAE